MPELVATRVAAGLSRPVWVTAPSGDRRRLFVVEKNGRIRILDLDSGQLHATPFLQLAGLSAGPEQGLLSLAFHPQHDQNGFFYVNFTDAAGATNIRRYGVSTATPDVADPDSAQTVLIIRQPFTNHNGGWMAFGPNDGFLYIAMGDGGSGNDPDNRAQNLGELLGKVLRIDVNADDFPDDPDRNYGIPQSNPFLGQAGARPEIWAYGVRNPWRCSFDRQTGDLYIADVGQNEREEINVQPASSRGGENYGWRLKEGTRVTGLDPLDDRPLVDPIHEYDHSAGRQAVIGGYVYRGPSLPELGGTYFFADHSGPIWSLRWSGVGASDLESRESELFPDDGPASISSFGEDAAGELYLVNLTPGEVYRVARKAEAGVAPPAARATAAHRALPKRGRFRSLRWTKAARAPAAPSAARVARAASADAIARAVAELGIPEVEDARTPVEEARFLLQAAAEIEHALLVQYLYGAYSLHVPAGAGVRDWRNWIVQIAREEMGHLLTVQNLLLAIGGSLHLDREDPTPDPGQAEAYPFPLRLQPLTLSSLAKYVTTESPLPEQLAPDVRARAEAAFALCGSTIGIGINHVGVLYARIYWLFQPDEIPQGPWRLPVGVFPDRHLKPTDFVATGLDRQADPSEGWQGADQGPLDGTIYVKTIPSLADGLQAIHYIAKQGEGWESSDNDDTHFERFLRIFEQFVLHLEQGGVYPTLPVPVNPFTSDPASPEPAAEQNRITSLPARLWADLFDLRYRMLVLELWLLMSLPRTDERRSLLIDHAIRVEMRIAIRQIAARLVGLPRKDEAPGESSSGVAAPPFRLAPGPLPTDAEGQRQMLRECMSAAATIAQQLESPENRQLLKQLRNADADLATALGT